MLNKYRKFITVLLLLTFVFDIMAFDAVVSSRLYAATDDQLQKQLEEAQKQFDAGNTASAQTAGQQQKAQAGINDAFNKQDDDNKLNATQTAELLNANGKVSQVNTNGATTNNGIKVGTVTGNTLGAVTTTAKGVQNALIKIGQTLQKIGNILTTVGKVLIAIGSVLKAIPWTHGAGVALCNAGNILVKVGTGMVNVGKVTEQFGQNASKGDANFGNLLKDIGTAWTNGWNTKDGETAINNGENTITKNVQNILGTGTTTNNTGNQANTNATNGNASDAAKADQVPPSRNGENIKQP